MAKKWTRFPHPDKAYTYEGAALKKNWGRLHRGDAEPYPQAEGAQRAWRHYHAGEFQQAAETGQAAGGTGINAAIKAQVIYANYLETEKSRLALFEEAAA
jgi:hypothetical protein